MVDASHTAAAGPVDPGVKRFSLTSLVLGVASVRGELPPPVGCPRPLASSASLLLRLENHSHKKAAITAKPPTTPTTIPATAPPLRPVLWLRIWASPFGSVGAGVAVTVLTVPPTIMVVMTGPWVGLPLEVVIDDEEEEEEEDEEVDEALADGCDDVTIIVGRTVLLELDGFFVVELPAGAVPVGLEPSTSMYPNSPSPPQ